MSMHLFDVDWNVIWPHMCLLAVAYLLAFPIGWNRERHSRSAGLRTFPLVAIATCGFMLVAIDIFDTDGAQARAMEGIITGMGFIGGGAILKGKEVVSGTATAASLWSTGAIGIAVAWQRLEIALLLSLLTFVTLQYVSIFIKPVVKRDGDDSNE
jgi:putative Mg2+ transporter-C (MgtC) family protein